MTNKLIKAIEQVNTLSYIADEYRIGKEASAVALKAFGKRAEVGIEPEIAEFLEFINGKMFSDWVIFRSTNDVPLFLDRKGDVPLFYSLRAGVQYDTFSTMRANRDLFHPKDLLLVGLSTGDYLVISFDTADYGRLYFVGRDVVQGSPNRILVADSLADWIGTMTLDAGE